MTHAASGKTRLAGIGFEDLTGAQRWLQARELEGIDREALLEGLRLSPSPDAALKSLVRLLGDHPAGLAEAVDRGSAAPALYRVLGASEALGDFLLRRPEHLDLLTGDPQRLPEVRGQEMARQYREDLLRCVGADPDHRMPVAETTGEQAQLALRTAYRAALTRIAVADLLAEDPLAELERIAACLADLAGAALEAALAVARAEIAQTYPEVSRVALAVIGMGKCGARELNYISDVDVIYAVGPAQPDPDEADGADDADDAQPLEEQRLVRLGEELVRALTQVIHGVGPEPALWEVDANLRPEGKDGPLVRTVDSHRAYCRRWAENWEFQALLKARPIAGDPQLGRQYLEAVTPFVWEASSREGFVGSVQAMRRRVSDHIPEAERERQIKLGIGGLRDVEFTVQLLQLVHGRTDEQVRTRGTLESLRALAERSYISREDARAFADRYRWLRLLEHRVQLRQLRRTHLMPAREREQLAVARAMQAPQERTRTTAEELLTRWREAKRSVRGLHEALFFRPLLAAVAHLSAAEVALRPDAARDRLAALGYLDPQGAMRHIEALTRGVSRRAEIQKTVLPVLLGWFARGVDPDAGLLNFRRVSEELGQTPWYLKMLRDSATAAQRLCEILSSSRFATDLIEVEPEAIAWLDKDEQLRPETLEELWTEIRAKVSRHRDAQEAVRAVRLIRRREMLRTAMGECTGVLDAEQIMRGLSDADQAAILGALHVAERELYEEQGEPVLTDVVIIGMGRQGGAEIGYGSDADVMYVHRARDGAGEQEALRQAERLVTRTVQLLKGPVEPAIRAERTLVIDADLRPEGRSGPMVRSLDSYAEYYARWSDTWEHQALLRARPLAGSDEVAEAFVRIIDPYRYPAELPPRRIQEIRRMKARVEAERMPRGADPTRQLKLGRGGLSDVEWLVQLLQLRHAHEHPELRTTSTLRALRAAVPLGLIGAEDVHVLESAWLLATRVRGGVVLRTGRASDSLPTARRDLEAIARWVGCAEGGARVLEEDYLRLTRRARGIYENLFYGPLTR